MSYTEGAAFGLIYPTSYAGLVHRANLLPNETLLVHAAAGTLLFSSFSLLLSTPLFFLSFLLVFLFSFSFLLFVVQFFEIYFK